jgi:hypothetical protein
MTSDEVRLAYLDQEVDALDRQLREERRKAGVSTLMSAMLGMSELLRDKKFGVLFELTGHPDRRRQQP